MCFQLQVPMLTQLIATAAKYRLVACCDCVGWVGCWTPLDTTVSLLCVLTCPGLIRVWLWCQCPAQPRQPVLHNTTLYHIDWTGRAGKARQTFSASRNTWSRTNKMYHNGMVSTYTTFFSIFNMLHVIPVVIILHNICINPFKSW